MWHSHFSPHLLSHLQSLKIYFQFLMKVFVVWIIYYCRINNSHFKGYLLPAIAFLFRFTVLYKSSIQAFLEIFLLLLFSHFFFQILLSFSFHYYLLHRIFYVLNTLKKEKTTILIQSIKLYIMHDVCCNINFQEGERILSCILIDDEAFIVIIL